MWWKKPFGIVAVALMVCSGTTAAQSQAIAPGNEWTAPCGPEEAGASARGGPLREPDLGQVHPDLPASAKGKAGPGFK